MIRPTHALRIIETTRNIKKTGSAILTSEPIDIQLWDLSGDVRFENSWLVAQRGADGVVLVYNADLKMNEEEMESWVKHFPQKMKMAPSQVLAVGYHMSGRGGVSNLEKVEKFSLEFEHFAMGENSEQFLERFDRFVGEIVTRKAQEVGEKNEI